MIDSASHDEGIHIPRQRAQSMSIAKSLPMNIPVFMSAFTHDVADDKEDRKVIIFISNNSVIYSCCNTCRIRDTSAVCKIIEILNCLSILVINIYVLEYKCFIYL